ncbi:hypothetical protein AWENTII_005611 [Aspergillus wentii]
MSPHRPGHCRHLSPPCRFILKGVAGDGALAGVVSEQLGSSVSQEEQCEKAQQEAGEKCQAEKHALEEQLESRCKQQQADIQAELNKCRAENTILTGKLRDSQAQIVGVTGWNGTLRGHILRDILRVYDPTGIAFSPDGRLLAIACIDGLKLWEVATGTVVDTKIEQRAPYRKRYRPIKVAFSPSGKELAVVSDNGDHYNAVNLCREEAIFQPGWACWQDDQRGCILAQRQDTCILV